MTARDDLVSLNQLAEFARETVSTAGQTTRSALDSNRTLQLALWKSVELTGEAANRVSRECQNRHPAIPWKQMVGLRNRLAHGYDSIDWDIVWKVATVELPAVQHQIAIALEREKARKNDH